MIQRSKERGAAMLIALGGLALIAALAVAALSASTGPATRAAAAVAQAEAQRTAEAAVHRLIAAGADADLRRALPADGRVVSTTFYDATLDISGQDAAGLVDLNIATDVVLARLLALTGAANADQIAQRWIDARGDDPGRGGFRTVADAINALPADLRAEANAAAPHLTVWSRRTSVDPYLATAPALAAAADIPLAVAQAFVASRTLDGRRVPVPEGADLTALALSDGTVIGLRVRATTASGGRAALTVVVRFTTSPRAPVTILSWQ